MFSPIGFRQFVFPNLFFPILSTNSSQSQQVKGQFWFSLKAIRFQVPLDKLLKGQITHLKFLIYEILFSPVPQFVCHVEVFNYLVRSKYTKMYIFVGSSSFCRTWGRTWCVQKLLWISETISVHRNCFPHVWAWNFHVLNL